jgi:hypothetical protein
MTPERNTTPPRRAGLLQRPQEHRRVDLGLVGEMRRAHHLGRQRRLDAPRRVSVKQVDHRPVVGLPAVLGAEVEVGAGS